MLGLPGTLDFTGIAQWWLREAAKGWAAEDLPLRRGQRAASTARDTINALAALSQCLRHSRDDRGDDSGMLGRADIVAFTSRLAHLQRTGQMTFRTRLRVTRRVFRFLGDLHVLGMTGPGQPAANKLDGNASRGGRLHRRSYGQPQKVRHLGSRKLQV